MCMCAFAINAYNMHAKKKRKHTPPAKATKGDALVANVPSNGETTSGE